MNRLAASPRRRSAPTIAVSLDLSDDAQKRIHELILRLHTGRWPLFRCLGMRQHGGVIYEAVQWLRGASPTFAVVEYCQDGLGFSSRPCKSRKAALSTLACRMLA